MLVADKWEDYELIDAEGGERLERWGKYILVRPDPEVVWTGERSDRRWTDADGIYKRSKSGGGSWDTNKTPGEWDISYGKLKFRVRTMGFKHTGIFPEQAPNWDRITNIIENGRRSDRKIKILNLFAYTGGATVACTAAGAEVCHVDASKGMVKLAKENMALSGLEDRPVRYIVDDCIKFLEREKRRSSLYDGIIMDPPSYGRGPKGEIWKLEDNISELLKAAVDVLSDDPLFILESSYTEGLSPYASGYVLGKALKDKRGELDRSNIQSDELLIPVTSGGLIPSGASVLWENH